MRIFCSLLIVIAIAVTGCDQSTNPSGAKPQPISGRVVDASGAAVSGAAIVMNYQTANDYEIPAGKPTVAIGYRLPEAGEVRLWITRRCARGMIRVLVDGYQPAGNHTVQWDSRNEAGEMVVEGVYEYHLETSSGTETHELFLQQTAYSSLTTTTDLEAFAWSDQAGRFSIDQYCLPFGYDGAIINEAGEEIGTFTILRSVRIWAVHDDHGATSPGEFEVDATSGAEVIIQFAP